jgi:hypothetical protein
VFLRESKLGLTPLTVVVEGDRRTALELKLDGYHPSTAVWKPDSRSRSIHVRLERAH